MSDESTLATAEARKFYESRPWLKHYPSYIPADITPRFANALESRDPGVVSGMPSPSELR